MTLQAQHSRRPVLQGISVDSSMKFGKQLQQLKETLGTERDSIPTLQYKGLKKLLKADHPPQSGTESC